MSDAPDGYSALTPVLVVNNAEAAIESYKKAVGAEVFGILHCPKTGKVAHCCMNIAGQSVFIYDAFPEMGMTETGVQNFYVYVESADAAAERAKSAGWEEAKPANDEFWGDRVATLKDVNGNCWMFAHKVRDVSPEEMQEVMKNMDAA